MDSIIHPSLYECNSQNPTLIRNFAPEFLSTVTKAMQIPAGKSIYFASDFHLGLPGEIGDSRKREQQICKWLDNISVDAAGLYLVGDVFDVWFEYRNVIPKGFTRFFGKLAELSDKGISIDLFTGNHDLWMNDYFQKEFGLTIHHQPYAVTINGKGFFIGHGDGLGPGDNGYKMLKRVLTHPIAQWLYRRIHPDTGVALADYFSKLGNKSFEAIPQFKGEDKEWLILFCKEQLKTRHYDYFIFGHRHLAMELPLEGNSRYINLGDWLHYNSYARFDGENLKLLYFNKKDGK